MTTPTTVPVRLRLRADTAANWTSVNPILLANELGRETDTGKIKIGNGTSTWTSLAYQAWATLPVAVNAGGTGQTSYTNGQLLIGNTTGNTLTKATLTAGSGVAITNGTGSITVAASGIANTNIAANAEIAVSKLQDGTARQLLQTAANGTDVEWASNIDIPGTLDVTGNAVFDANLTVQGDLTVNGTETIINTQTLTVEDKNIELGKITSPTDVTADGGGITLKGTTDKTINWIDATDAWTLSEHVDLATGKEYRINGAQVLTGTALGSGVTSSSLTSVGTISSGTWQGTTVGTAYGGTGQTTYTNGQLLIGKTDGTLAKATLTAGTGVAVTNADGSITVAVDSTVVTTAQTGTVTSTMIADGTIVDADVNASAAIAGTKISPDFGSQNVVTTGTSTAASLIPTGSSVPTNGVYLPAANSVGISTNGTGRLFVNSAGRVLVGTSTALPAGDSTPFFQVVGAGAGAWQSLIRTGATVGGSHLVLGQTRGSVGSRTIAQANDILNTIAFVGDNGVDLNTSAASIKAEVDGTPGANAMPGRLVFSTTPSGSGTTTERMRLDSAGRLGLGTSAPESVLSVNNATNASGTGDFGGVFLSSVGATPGLNNLGSAISFSRINSTRRGAMIASVESGTSTNQQGLAFFTRGITTTANSDVAERLRIDDQGRVGIGTTSPGNNLTVAQPGTGVTATTEILAGTIGSPSGANVSRVLFSTIGGGGGAATATLSHLVSSSQFVLRAETGGGHEWYVGGSERARIDSSGRLLVGTASDSGGALLQVNGNRIRIATANTPASASATGTTGEIAWDADYIYVCTATNTWKRTAISTW
jgi:hypothetical protein